MYTLLCFDICFLAYLYNSVVMLALNHGISRVLDHISVNSIGMFNNLHPVSKKSKYFGQSSSSNSSLVGASCHLFSLTRTSSHQIAPITPIITFVMGCDESGKPMESSSPEFQNNIRLLRPGYHHVCSKQWRGISSCVNMIFLQFRFPDASSSGFIFIITLRFS